MGIIEDGTSGNVAAVDAESRLKVMASTVELVHEISHKKFSAWIFCVTITTDGTENVVFHLKNDNDDDYALSEISLVSTTDAVWKFKVNSTYTSGGAAYVGVNLNLNSTLESGLTVYSGDDITVSDGTMIACDLTKGGYAAEEFSFDGALIIGPGKTLHVSCDAPTGTAYAYFILFKLEESD